MTAQQLVSSEEHVIDGESAISVVRSRVRALAERYHFDTFATAAVVTATSELARNVWHHAHRGHASIDVLNREGRAGLRITFRDEGPGIGNLDAVLAGRYSRTNSLGLGVSGSKRLVDQFEIKSMAGQGTTVIITKWKRLA